MREAAIKGGLVPDTPEGRERIEFVTEGEASFHWCVDMELANAALAVPLPLPFESRDMPPQLNFKLVAQQPNCHCRRRWRNDRRLVVPGHLVEAAPSPREFYCCM